jgi:hypothetical protein
MRSKKGCDARFISQSRKAALLVRSAGGIFFAAEAFCRVGVGLAPTF